MLDTPPPAPADIPHLTEAYQKAHKNYALISGILIAWELIGIELTPEPFENVNIKLVSPDAAPFVLLALVCYFAFRISIEWLHCDVRRRQLQPARIDFAASHLLGTAALAIYLVQRALEVQIYASLDPRLLVSWSLLPPTLYFAFLSPPFRSRTLKFALAALACFAVYNLVMVFGTRGLAVASVANSVLGLVVGVANAALLASSGKETFRWMFPMFPIGRRE